MDVNRYSSRDQLTATWVELAIRLGVLALLLYWSFLLIRPFITIMIWSVVLTVALYPVYDWMVVRFNGRRRLAAISLTILEIIQRAASYFAFPFWCGVASTASEINEAITRPVWA